MAGRSPVHVIVELLSRALGAIGSPAATQDVERWGFSIHAALSAPGRRYHTHGHVIGIASEGDPLAVIAALYHDAVYVQVDQGLPRLMRGETDRVLAAVEGGWRILPEAGADPVTADVLAVFGRNVDEVATATTGLNELASALVASLQLASALDRHQRIAVAACIEQTIPFRVDALPALRDRLAGLGLHGEALDATLRRAVRLGNLDVANFADDDAARFLDSTWKLLPESNPALHQPAVYSVRDYRIALQKMEGFLSWLPAERVFHAWGAEPGAEVHARRVARTAENLRLAVRYLRAKLFGIAMVEAIAELTGGDVPLDYFMGGLEQVGGGTGSRIEDHLPDAVAGLAVDPLLDLLLSQGRASEASFDTSASPLASFLHRSMGEVALMEGVERARQWWAGACDASTFLSARPSEPAAAIARAAANVVQTRRDRLVALAERLDARP